MAITPPDTLNSTRSPALIPAWRRTLGGTTKPALSVTVMVMGCTEKSRNSEASEIA
jgi:hypothetical protein